MDSCIAYLIVRMISVGLLATLIHLNAPAATAHASAAVFCAGLYILVIALNARNQHADWARGYLHGGCPFAGRNRLQVCTLPRPYPSVAFHRLPSPSIACHRLPSPAIACHRLPSPSIAFHRLPSPSMAFADTCPFALGVGCLQGRSPLGPVGISALAAFAGLPLFFMLIPALVQIIAIGTVGSAFGHTLMLASLRCVHLARISRASRMYLPCISRASFVPQTASTGTTHHPPSPPSPPSLPLGHLRAHSRPHPCTLTCTPTDLFSPSLPQHRLGISRL